MNTRRYLNLDKLARIKAAPLTTSAAEYPLHIPFFPNIFSGLYRRHHHSAIVIIQIDPLLPSHRRHLFPRPSRCRPERTTSRSTSRNGSPRVNVRYRPTSLMLQVRTTRVWLFHRRRDRNVDHASRRTAESRPPRRTTPGCPRILGAFAPPSVRSNGDRRFAGVGFANVVARRPLL
jgi:hypothetical protein